MVEFDTPGISKCLTTLYLLSPHLCLIIGFICDLFVARIDAWMSFLFVCVEVLQPSQPNGVMSSAVSLPNHTFTGQA